MISYVQMRSYRRYEMWNNYSVCRVEDKSRFSETVRQNVRERR